MTKKDIKLKDLSFKIKKDMMLKLDLISRLEETLLAVSKPSQIIEKIHPKLH